MTPDILEGGGCAFSILFVKIHTDRILVVGNI
jgi:hypothetical protein